MMIDSPPEAPPNRHLGFRIAVGLVGLVFVALFIVLGRVASKQSDTQQALETAKSLRAAPAPAQSKETP
jgi:hypothetical protein